LKKTWDTAGLSKEVLKNSKEVRPERIEKKRSKVKEENREKKQ
jgi:hypothetical protein